MSRKASEDKIQNQNDDKIEIEDNSEVNKKQKFTIFCGTYEGAIVGLAGDLNKLDLKYAFKPSTNSLKCMDIVGKYLVVGGFDEYLRIYDLKRQRECGILEGHLGTITSIKGHQSIVFSCAEDGNIMAWKMKEFGLLHTLKEHKDQVHDIAVHNSGKIMVSIAKDKRLIIWNLINAKKVFSMNLKYNAYKLELTEKHIITMSDFDIHVIDQETNQEVCVLKQDKQVTINDFVVYEEQLIITGDNNGYVFIYDIESKCHLSFKAHETRVKKLKVCKIDGIDVIITISTNGEIHLFDCLIIFQHVFEINESQELKDVKPIYKVNTLNRLTSLAIYMDAAKDKPNNDEQEDEEKQKQQQQEQIKKQQEKEKQEKKKNQNKIKVTIEKENQDVKKFVIDSSKIKKTIQKKKKKMLKQQQKAANKHPNQKQQGGNHQNNKQQQKEQKQSNHPQQKKQHDKQNQKQKKSVRFG